MKSILQWLFESELNIPMEQEEAYQYAEAGEKVIDAKEDVSLRIPQELREKWQTFLNKQDSYHEWERRMEFDRGFYLAVRIILELLRGGLKL